MGGANLAGQMSAGLSCWREGGYAKEVVVSGSGARQVARVLVVPGDGRGTENRGRRGSEAMGLGG